MKASHVARKVDHWREFLVNCRGLLAVKSWKLKFHFYLSRWRSSLRGTTSRSAFLLLMGRHAGWRIFSPTLHRPRCHLPSRTMHLVPWPNQPSQSHFWDPTDSQNHLLVISSASLPRQHGARSMTTTKPFRITEEPCVLDMILGKVRWIQVIRCASRGCDSSLPLKLHPIFLLSVEPSSNFSSVLHFNHLISAYPPSLQVK